MARSLIFIVEDSQLLAALLLDALQAHAVGDEVRSFRSAAPAREAHEEVLAAQDQMGLFVVDIEMPGEDGLSFGRSVRERELAAGASPAPIVFYSSCALSLDIEAAVADCFPARFVQKADEAGPAAVAREGALLLKRMLDREGG